MILAGCALALGLASCEMKNELWEKEGNTSGEMGLLDLSLAVNAANNVVTKAAVDGGTEVNGPTVSADGFELDITNADGSYKKTHEYDPENTTIELPVGDYTVTAHTPGEPVITDPFYSGKKSFTIAAGETEPVEVLCKMANTKIQVTFDQSLWDDEFQSWTVTVTPVGVSDMAWPFSGKSGETTQPDPIYWMLPDNVKTIRAEFHGVNKDGENVIVSYTFEKPVEADDENWTGADALAITVKSEKTTEENPSGVNGVTIDAEVTWDELEDSVTIPVEGTETEPTDPSEPGTGTEEPDEPATGDEPKIVLSGTEYTLPADASKTVNATITASAGLKSVYVQIVGGNDMFQSIASSTLDGGNLELIGCTNETLTGALSSMQVDLPAAGATEYIFPVSVFFMFLDPNTMGPTTSPDGHVFNITVTDNNDKTVKASLKVHAVAAATE